MNYVDSPNIQNKVFSGMFWKFAERIMAQGISFIVSIVLARILTPDEYGVVAIVTVFITIANVFVTSGLPTSLVQKKDVEDIDFSTILYCNIVFSACIYMVLFFSAPWIADYYGIAELTEIIRVFSLKIMFAAYDSVQQAYVQRKMIFRKFFFSTLGATIVSGIVGIWMAISGFGVWALVAQYLSNTIIGMLILSFAIDWRPKLLFSWKRASGLINYGWKILAADLLGNIYNNLRALLIGKVYTSADLAYYNRGKQFPELISNNIDTTVNSVLFPAMSGVSDDVERVKAMTRRSMKISSYVIFPILFGMAVVAEPLVEVLLTDKWLPCVPFLQLICIAKAISVVTNANLQALKAIGRSDVVLKLEFVKKPVGLLLIFGAIRISILAVAISMPLYSLYATFMNMQPNKKYLNYGFWNQIKDLVPATILSGAMTLLVYAFTWLRWNPLVTLVIQVLIGVVFYVCMSIVFKVEAFEYVLSFVKKAGNKKEKKNG